MTDRRTLRSNGRVAHVSLKGHVEAENYAEGVDHRVLWSPVASLCDAPFGRRDRELLCGQTFCVLETLDGWSFGFAQADGYVGYVEAHMLQADTKKSTHRVCVRQTMALGEPDFKASKAEHVP